MQRKEEAEVEVMIHIAKEQTRQTIGQGVPVDVSRTLLLGGGVECC